MKTIRQVKTVFIIFIAYVSCWSPYIVVLLYDTADSLPLPVHLYASMLAHLHASINFAIYGLMNPNLRTGCASRLMGCCRRLAAANPAAAAATATATTRITSRTALGLSTRTADVNRSVITFEYPEYQTINDCGCTNIQ